MLRMRKEKRHACFAAYRLCLNGSLMVFREND
jgi:hypothetical protein